MIHPCGLINMANSILRWYKPIGVLNPCGPLSSKLLSRAIELANKEVEGILSKSKREAHIRANVRKYAIYHCVNEAAL